MLMRYKKHYLSLIIGILLPMITSVLANAGYLDLESSDIGESILTNRSTFSFTTDSPFTVVKVVDGDTIDIAQNGETIRVRLIGINTPETVDPRRPVECFGKEASNHAKGLLTGKTVTVETDPSQGMYDKYQRLLAYVVLPDGSSFNKRMIAEGYAYEYTYDIPYKYQKTFKDAQSIAREKELGLWSPQTCSGKK